MYTNRYNIGIIFRFIGTKVIGNTYKYIKQFLWKKVTKFLPIDFRDLSLSSHNSEKCEEISPARSSISFTIN